VVVQCAIRASLARKYLASLGFVRVLGQDRHTKTNLKSILCSDIVYSKYVRILTFENFCTVLSLFLRLSCAFLLTSVPA
jgi:hypothetical protein